MRNLLLLISILCVSLACTKGSAQEGIQQEMKYRRNSICSMLLNHNEQSYSNDIKELFVAIPVPDKYNDHGLCVNTVTVQRKGDYTSDITEFVNRNCIGSRLVAKWFNRNFQTGECDMELVKERGFYNASEFDKEIANHSVRGIALLQDAGEDLIGNTFLLVNEVSYTDEKDGAKTWGLANTALNFVAGAVKGRNSSLQSGLRYGEVRSILKNFSVRIHTRLYQLVWDEESSNAFYTLYYSNKPDEQKTLDFDKNRDKFKMKYIGDVESKGSQTSFLGIKEEEPFMMVRKACQRAIDENVAELQKKYEQFKIKAPILSVDPSIKVQIGMKEGITQNSKFEVLEALDVDGKIVYKQVGIIKPIADKIWDNRFMAMEEGAYGADLKATKFVKVSGGDFYPGMLIREIK